MLQLVDDVEEGGVCIADSTERVSVRCYIHRRQCIRLDREGRRRDQCSDKKRADGYNKTW